MAIRAPQWYQIPGATQDCKIVLDFNIDPPPPPLRELEFSMCGDPTPTGLEIVSIVGNDGDRIEYAPPADPVMSSLLSMNSPVRSTSNIFTITVNNKNPNPLPLVIGATFKGVT